MPYFYYRKIWLKPIDDDGSLLNQTPYSGVLNFKWLGFDLTVVKKYKIL
jgi:hypothetical protein